MIACFDLVNLVEIAQRTPGFSDAHLKNVVNEAALLAARGGSKFVGAEHLYEAIDRVVAGPERKSRIISEHEKKIMEIEEKIRKRKEEQEEKRQKHQSGIDALLDLQRE